MSVRQEGIVAEEEGILILHGEGNLVRLRWKGENSIYNVNIYEYIYRERDIDIDIDTYIDIDMCIYR